MEKKIVGPGGREYMTVTAVGDRIEFRNFGANKVTVSFDAKTLDQLIPFLSEVNFWNKVKEEPNEKSY